jgi:hypothetical protein
MLLTSLSTSLLKELQLQLEYDIHMYVLYIYEYIIYIHIYIYMLKYVHMSVNTSFQKELLTSRLRSTYK